MPDDAPIHEEVLGPIVFPDPLTSTSRISAATFLYFDERVILPSPIWIPDETAYGLHDLVATRRPDWAGRFFWTDSLYGSQVESWKRTTDLLEPLGDAFSSALYAFDADSGALAEGQAFLDSTGVSAEQALEMIDVGAAAGEVFHHLLIDQYSEFEGDLEALYRYTADFFAAGSPSEVLVPCYLPRLRLSPHVAQAGNEMLFNNAGLLPLLERLPVEVVGEPDVTISVSVIAWELFSQILAKELDPLDAGRIDRLATVRRRNREEIDALKAKCVLLAETIPQPGTLHDLVPVVERFLRHEVDSEIQSLLGLNRAAMDRFVQSVLTDEKSWLTTLGAGAAAFSGEPLLTAGAALAAVSSVGAKAAKSAFERRDRLRTSDYRLLYHVGRG
jgi:hypothetical protein